MRGTRCHDYRLASDREADGTELNERRRMNLTAPPNEFMYL